MISAVAFCPMAPVLVPEIAQGAALELDDLRTACRVAIERLAAPGRKIVVIGPGETSRPYGPTARGTFAGFGLPLELALGSDDAGPVELPLSLTVGAWLLRDALGPGCGASGWSVEDPFAAELESWDDSAWWAGEDVAVLVMGDGSARRTLKAPGYLDDRAAGFDARVARALSTGTGAGLHFPAGDEGLLASGPIVWELLSWSVQAASWDAELLYDGAPYGVGYLVAAWTARPPDPAAHDEAGTERIETGAGWGARVLRSVGRRLGSSRTAVRGAG